VPFSTVLSEHQACRSGAVGYTYSLGVQSAVLSRLCKYMLWCLQENYLGLGVWLKR
jgi:hypothetical protein